jgi:hypothetical protein
MWTFIFAGVLYLTGVAVVLVIRPAFMFDASGNWLEFGIGKPADKFTPFPFWMFCLAWALVSYAIVLIVCKFAFPGSMSPVAMPSLPPLAVGPAGSVQTLEPTPLSHAAAAVHAAVELPKGYYVLNRKATKLSGTPKYVYLGTEEP